MSQIQSVALWAVFIIAILNLYLTLWFGGNWVISEIFKHNH
jgi:hypothetical protein